MTRPPMRRRTVHVPDDVWAAAMAAAAARGEVLSEELRRFLIRYAARK